MSSQGKTAVSVRSADGLRRPVGWRFSQLRGSRRAALKLGLQQVPVHTATGLTPAQIKAYGRTDQRGRLDDCIDLQTQTKQAHWNVKGLNFIALDELFDGINEEVEDDVT